MSLQKHSFSELISPSARYLDEFLNYNQTKTKFEQGFDLNFIDALSSINDVKINNYSSLYLTNLITDNRIFSTNTLDSLSQNIVTYLAVLTTGNQFSYLNFDLTLSGGPIAGTDAVNPNNQNLPTITVNPDGTLRVVSSQRPTREIINYSFTLSGDILDTSSVYFQLETLDDKICRIKHTENEVDYYLAYSRGEPYTSSFYFVTSFNADNVPAGYNSAYKECFDYVLDSSGYMQLTKWVAGEYYLVTVEDSRLKLQQLTSNLDLEKYNCLFKVLITDTSISPKLNTSWVSYKTTETDYPNINLNKSTLGLKTNNILHFEYENMTGLSSLDVNTLKLKNTYTDKYISKRGNCIVNSTFNTPVPFFREYTNIYTGGDQEAGYRDITLNYVFYNQDYNFPAGQRTEFTTASSMLPFDQINVNDTSFVADGSLGFSIPVLSDRITTKNSLNTVDVYGSYLTTWLSGNTWVDRYYFPDMVSRKTALSGNPVFQPTFDNVLTKLAYLSSQKIEKLQYFDVISDLAFYPNETYYYERVGFDDVTTYVNSICNLVQVGFTDVTTNEGVTNSTPVTSVAFEGNKYTSIPVQSINDTGSFTVFFTMKNTLTNKFNYVMGNLIEDGFGVYSDSAITPIMYLKKDNVLNAFNTDTSLIYSLSFDETILDVVDPGGLNDFHVIAGNNVYNISTDGTIIAKVNVPEISGYIDYHHDNGKIYFLTTPTTYLEYDTTSNLYVTGNKVTTFSTNEIETNGIFYHKGTVYGFAASNLKKDPENFLYGVYDNSTILRYQLDQPFEDTTVFARSGSIIRDFNIDRDGNLWMLHNNYELTKVDKNRKFLNNLSFVDLLTCYSIDFVNEYVGSTDKFYPVVLATDADKNVYTIKDIDFATNVNTTLLAMPSGFRGEQQNITGYNAFIDNTDYKNINFEIRLSNIFNYLDKQNFKFSIPKETLSKFSNTFCFSYSNDGVVSLYLNSTLVGSQAVDQYKYIGNVFVRDNIIVGTVPFHNNTILSDFLGIPAYSKLAYTELSNFRFYNRGLSDTEIKSLYLYKSGNINQLYTSLPCGQRNNVEEIQNLFKFTQPSFKSNVVDILVKDSGIEDLSLQQQLATGIVAEIKTSIPGDVTVRDVKFINY